LDFFAETFFPNDPATYYIGMTRITSPFAASFDIPLQSQLVEEEYVGGRTWTTFTGYMTFAVLANAALLGSMIWLFNTRWRVAQ
jgi:hypothetical protein